MKPQQQEPDETRPAADLLPVVSDELGRLAAALTQQLRPEQTLQATALVHEASLRLVGDHAPCCQGRRHFLGAAAQAMRQILIEKPRRKTTRSASRARRDDAPGSV